MKHTYATPAQVGTNVRSVTQSWLGAVAANWRFTRSGCRSAAGSGLVVRTRLPRRTPSMPGTHQPGHLVTADIVAGPAGDFHSLRAP